jgi:hypothetical protein
VGRAGLPDVRGFGAFRARIRAPFESGFEGGAVKRLTRPATRDRYFRFGIKRKSVIINLKYVPFFRERFART